MIDVGTEITCPNCHEPMMVCIKKPVIGEPNASFFASLKFDVIKKGAPVCPYDGTYFWHHKAGLHTEQWGFTW